MNTREPQPLPINYEDYRVEQPACWECGRFIKRDEVVRVRKVAFGFYYYEELCPKHGQTEGGLSMEPVITEGMIVKVLRRSADRLTDKAWTTGTNARDIVGRPTDSDGEDACQWCVIGALGRETSLTLEDYQHLQMTDGRIDGKAWLLLYRQALNAMRPQIGMAPSKGDLDSYTAGAGVAHWNDRPGRTAEEVRRALREAANQLEFGVTSHG